MKIAALFVEAGGCYFGLPSIDPWDIGRDARFYRGPHPIIAHPPCERWGRYWHGSPRKPHQYRLGDDSGCFAAALRSLLLCGGVLEHPAYSNAWKAFDLPKPVTAGGWRTVGHVEQGHYGHIARKARRLLACRLPSLPDLIWGPAPQRLPQIAVERYGYEKARRTGVMAYIGGKDKTKLRAQTPELFRELLIELLRGSLSICSGARRMNCHLNSTVTVGHRCASRALSGGCRREGGRLCLKCCSVGCRPHAQELGARMERVVTQFG